MENAAHTTAIKDSINNEESYQTNQAEDAHTDLTVQREITSKNAEQSDDLSPTSRFDEAQNSEKQKLEAEHSEESCEIEIVKEEERINNVRRSRRKAFCKRNNEFL